MELAVIFSRALVGLEAPLVRVEVHLANGLPAFHIVGMPETSVRESRERVRAALLNSHFEFPDRRITVSLAPADLPKGGGRFDLPIALGILAASGQLPQPALQAHEFLGELALDGGLRSVPGVLSAAREARSSSRALVVPADCAERAAHQPGSTVLGAPDLLSLCAHLNGRQALAPAVATAPDEGSRYPDLADISGQSLARRALEITAAGGHNLLLTGPPGTGKTLLASRLPGILPPPGTEEALLGLALQELHPGGQTAASFQRPFRSPHHSCSAVALVGGGNRLQPGEISLAHGGVLFLDELPEFSRHALEMLRQPLESGEITLSRANRKTRYPARFQLVAAMNPCPCGYLGDANRACHCSPEQVQRYRSRLSGPLLDRIDLHTEVPRIPADELLESSTCGEDSATVRGRVCAARERQLARQGCANAELSARQLARRCGLDGPLRRYLAQAADGLQLSPRALHRSLRVARTLADLAGVERVAEEHLAEALAYRGLAPG